MGKTLSLMALLTLGACAGSPGATSVPATSGSDTRPLTTTVQTGVQDPVATGGGFRPPNMQRASGLDGVVGAPAEQLLSAFGTARIDLAEGDARKLQFASAECVLDIFLYPLEPGQTPIATHVEARSQQGGAEFDRARCIEQISQR